MAFPITPAIISGLGIPDYMFGVAFATMNFFSFLMAPIWGRLSDLYGRGRVLVVSLLGAAAGQTILCFCVNAPTLILARAVTGCFNAGHLINTMAYFIESGEESARQRNLAMHVTFSTLFSAIGYLVGGLLGNRSHSLTFSLQIGLLLFCGVTLLPLIGEPPLREKPAVSAGKGMLAAFRGAQYLMTPTLLLSLALTIVATVGTNLFDEAFNYFLSDNLGFMPSRIGGLRAVTGLLGLAGYFLISKRLLRGNRLRPAQVAIYGCCALALAMVVASGSVPGFLACAITFTFCNSIANSLLQVSVVGSVPPESIGTAAGVFQSSKTMGSVIGALLSGFVYMVDQTLPFRVSAYVFGGAALLALVTLIVVGKADRSQ